MAEFWEEIDGWFNFYRLYTDMIDKYDNAVFIEIGTWLGRSAGFMGLRIKESGKKIRFYAIDLFAPYIQGGVEQKGVTFDEFNANMAPVRNYVIPIRGSSHDVCSQFEDCSVDFLFIDGNHTYEFVRKDLELWFPKIRAGGVIAGHDYSWDGVRRAVDEFFFGKGDIDMSYYKESGTWLVRIQ